MTVDITNIFSTENQYKKKLLKDGDLNQNNKEKEISIGVIQRVSSDKQALEGESLEMQEELAIEHAKKIGGKIYKFYPEEALSAYKTRIEKRKKIQELMQDIRDNKVNYVIAYKRDRMFRNNIEHMQFFQFLAEHNCDIYYTARGEIQTDLSAFKVAGVSKMMETMLSMMAELESAQTSARVSDTMISIASRGKRTGGNLPIGYKYDEDKIVPIEETKCLIKLVEDLYLQGYGIKSIVKYLNGGKVNGLKQLSQPYPKPMEHAFSEVWNESNIKTILFNPIYTGYLSYQSKKNLDMDRIIVKSDEVTPIRSLETQQKIFELYNKKKESKKPPRAYNTPFLLSGLLYCSECGAKYRTTTTQKKDGTRHSYYKCANRYSTKMHSCEDSKTYKKEVIEKLIIEVTKEKIKDFLDLNTYEIYKTKIDNEKHKANLQLETIEKKIVNLNKKLNEYAELITELEDDKELKMFYLNKQKESLKEINELKNIRTELVTSIKQEEMNKDSYKRFLNIAKDFDKIIDNSPVSIQKQLLENLFSKIYVDKNGDISLELNMGVKNEEQSIISLDKVGEGTLPKDIIVNTTDYTMSFNYFKTLKNILQKASDSFLQFLIHIEPEFKTDNKYMESKLNISTFQRKRIKKGWLPKINDIENYFQILNASFDDFLNFIKIEHPTFIGNKEIIEDAQLIFSSKSLQAKYLFDGLIKCENCGNDYTGKTNMDSIRYRCVKNRSDIENRCQSKSINENVIIDLIKKEKGQVFNLLDVKNIIEKILVNKDGNFKIIYK